MNRTDAIKTLTGPAHSYAGDLAMRLVERASQNGSEVTSRVLVTYAGDDTYTVRACYRGARGVLTEAVRYGSEPGIVFPVQADFAVFPVSDLRGAARGKAWGHITDVRADGFGPAGSASEVAADPDGPACYQAFDRAGRYLAETHGLRAAMMAIQLACTRGH
jgi:hypothetical protein